MKRRGFLKMLSSVTAAIPALQAVAKTEATLPAVKLDAPGKVSIDQTVIADGTLYTPHTYERWPGSAYGEGPFMLMGGGHHASGEGAFMLIDGDWIILNPDKPLFDLERKVNHTS